MAQTQDISCGLDFMSVPDVSACLTEALQNKYKFAVLPIVHPRLRRHYVGGNAVKCGFTRSDMLLSPQDWNVRIVGKLSPYLDVDNSCPAVRMRHEDCLNEELTYCRGLGLPALMFTLRGSECNNLARILQNYYLQSHNPSILWVRVPMKADHMTSQEDDDDLISADESSYDEPWRWWSRFQERMEWDKRVGVVLELSADLPPARVFARWLGEPVKCVVVPTSLFHLNRKGYPVLSRAHQTVVRSFVEHDAQVLISGAHRSAPLHYIQYLYHLWDTRPHKAIDDPMLAYARGWEDYLQTPLQPLADNLDTHTYNVFEKDPVKYDQYQRAIAAALLHLRGIQQLQDGDVNPSMNSGTQPDPANTEHQSIDSTPAAQSATASSPTGDVSPPIETGEEGKKETDEDHQVLTVMVLGAGRGPLVRATLNAAEITGSKIEVLAVEKNPCAVVALVAQAQELWVNKRVRVLAGDMRRITPPRPADIIVSELLGSWGDNELSPECLDGAAPLLRPGGLSIPSSYTSFTGPVSSARLWAAAKAAPSATAGLAGAEKNLETLWVVYMQNKYDIAEAKPVFTFTHPASSPPDADGPTSSNHTSPPDNRRCTHLSWRANQEAVLHGFAGYFSCELYGGESISIVPATHSAGMISWFPVFIPVKTPLRVNAGDTITATFWRCVSPRRVWYEWTASCGERKTPLHNPNGRSSEMLL